MAIEPTAAILGEVTRFAHRNSQRFVQMIIERGDEELWGDIVTEITNDERHAQARAALDLLWGVGLRNGDITLTQLVNEADWSPPDSEG